MFNSRRGLFICATMRYQVTALQQVRYAAGPYGVASPGGGPGHPRPRSPSSRRSRPRRPRTSTTRPNAGGNGTAVSDPRRCQDRLRRAIGLPAGYCLSAPGAVPPRERRDRAPLRVGHPRRRNRRPRCSHSATASRRWKRTGRVSRCPPASLASMDAKPLPRSVASPVAELPEARTLRAPTRRLT